LFLKNHGHLTFSRRKKEQERPKLISNFGRLLFYSLILHVSCPLFSERFLFIYLMFDFYWYWCCFLSMLSWWWPMSKASSNLMSSFWSTCRLCPLLLLDGSKPWIHLIFVFLSSSLPLYKYLIFASWQMIGKKYCYCEHQGSAILCKMAASVALCYGYEDKKKGSSKWSLG
jgi:hypothetical protein